MDIMDKAYLKAAWKAIDDKFGKDIVMLAITEISPMADYFIITTGNSPSQIRAISDAVQEALLKEGLKLNHAEGTTSLNWVLLDFSQIIIHIFDKENREFYNLERTWGDAKNISLEQLN